MIVKKFQWRYRYNYPCIIPSPSSCLELWVIHLYCCCSYASWWIDAPSRFQREIILSLQLNYHQDRICSLSHDSSLSGQPSLPCCEMEGKYFQDRERHTLDSEMGDKYFQFMFIFLRGTSVLWPQYKLQMSFQNNILFLKVIHSFFYLPDQTIFMTTAIWWESQLQE